MKPSEDFSCAPLKKYSAWLADKVDRGGSHKLSTELTGRHKCPVREVTGEIMACGVSEEVVSGCFGNFREKGEVTPAAY